MTNINAKKKKVEKIFLFKKLFWESLKQIAMHRCQWKVSIKRPRNAIETYFYQVYVMQQQDERENMCTDKQIH